MYKRQLTCVIGFITFSEIAANRISSSKGFINGIRILALFVAAFGIACSIAGYDLSNLWAFSDLGNIIIVYCNVPILYMGFKYVLKATKQYTENENEKFTGEIIGMDLPVWKKD